MLIKNNSTKKYNENSIKNRFLFKSIKNVYLNFINPCQFYFDIHEVHQDLFSKRTHQVQIYHF